MALAGCAPQHPLVDMTNVDPVAYQRVLDRCDAIASPGSGSGPLVAGVLIGGTMGLGAGAFISGLVDEGGAAIGAASGAAVGAAAATVGKDSALVKSVSAAPPQTVDACLTGHGYKIVGHI